ncbi:MAG: RHS repeat domain-containing protein [Pyrinomonadaceae bacterium]
MRESNPTTGQQNPLPFTPIEDSDISKSTNRFTTDTTYDEAGMVTTDEKFRDMAFSYDANGRMVKATRSETPDAWTVYDALGNRVATEVNDVWRFSIYDAFGKLVAEYGQADEGVGGIRYIQQDWQGSVRTVTNSNGFVVSRTDHQAFGENIGAGVGLRSTTQGYYGAIQTRQGYGLTERDDATGLDHTWFRKNEASAGRWTSPDPYKGSMQLGDPQSFNRYSYVVNQPTNFVDPTGLVGEPGEACDYQGTGSDGNPIYHGTYDQNGICRSNSGQPVQIDWDWSIFFIGRDYFSQTIDRPDPGNIPGGGTGNPNSLFPEIKGISKEEVERKKKDNNERWEKFKECVRREMQPIFNEIRTRLILAAAALGGASAAPGQGGGSDGHRAARGWGAARRLAILIGLFMTFQNDAERWNGAQQQAQEKCRQETGYSGPIRDERPWFFRSASSLFGG